MDYVTKKDIVIPKKKKTSHKGDNGRVLIIGGSPDYVGALALAGIAALRSGVDWVTVAAPEKVGWAINTLSPDLVVKKVKGDYFSSKHVHMMLAMEKMYDVVLIGNGIGLKSKSFVVNYVKKSKKKLVIDADALKFVSLSNVDNSILTPHKREFDILMKNSKLNKNNYQKKLKNNIILLKGPVDKIVSKTKIAYNKTGNPGLAKAGTGDVLAGLCAGFYAQGLSAIQAAKNAAYVNGVIGDLQLKKKKGYFFLASDLLDDIKRVV